VPPFFGRIDRLPDRERPDGETFHVGRRHIRDRVGDPLVIDWRAPMSRAFYRATPAEPMGVRRRRRFGFAAGLLTSYEDEPLTAGAEVAAIESRILLEEIERPRVGPMRDIVATIQPDQDDWSGPTRRRSACRARRAPARRRSACTGRPTCSTPTRTGCGGPACWWSGRTGRSCATSARCCRPWARSASRRRPWTTCSRRCRCGRVDPPAVATLKGDARLAEVLRRAVRRRIRRPEDGVVVIVGTHRYRIPPSGCAGTSTTCAAGDIPYATARDRLRLHWPRTSPAAGGGRRRRRTRRPPGWRGRRRCASSSDAVWPAVDPAALLRELYTDPAALAAAARGLLDPEEQELLIWAKPPRSAKSARWSAADAVLVDEIAGLVARPESYGHVVLDEAQDLSAMQCRGVARRCPLGSITVLGDLAQGTTPWSTEDWHVTLAHLGKPAAGSSR
jgi:hypothetical protein